MACAPSDLITATKRIQGLGDHELRAMAMVSLCNIADNLGTDAGVDLEALRTEAKCMLCLSDHEFLRFLVWLLAKVDAGVAAVGGLSVNAGVFCGHYGGVAPAFVPTGSAAVAYDLDSPYAMWRWNPDTATWE